MRKYISLFFSALVFLCSCSDDTPKGIIDEKHMVSLLTDVHLTDASMFSIVGTPDSLYKYGTARFKVVFDKHHTDSGTFVKSFKYYSQNPAKLVSIYDEVTAGLTKKTDSLNKLYQKQLAMEQKKLNSKLAAPKKNPAADSLRKAMEQKINNRPSLNRISAIMKAKRDSINARKNKLQSKKLKNGKPAKVAL